MASDRCRLARGRRAEAIRRAMEAQGSAEAIAKAPRGLQQSHEIAASIRQSIERVHAANQVHFERLQVNFQQFAPQIERVVQGLQELYVPDNWHGLESGLLGVVVVVDSAIPVVWAPRGVIVDALIAAPAADRYGVLMNASDWVLDDIDAVLDRARGAEVAGHRDACESAGEAIAAARDGHWAAAQALTASGLTQAIHGMAGYEGFKGLSKARKKFRQRDLDEATMMVLKVGLLETCTANALTDIHEAKAQPFYRHGTQHGDRKFFSQADALTGLLLLVGWIREFTWVAENRPGILDGDL